MFITNRCAAFQLITRIAILTVPCWMGVREALQSPEDFNWPRLFVSLITINVQRGISKFYPEIKMRHTYFLELKYFIMKIDKQA